VTVTVIGYQVGYVHFFHPFDATGGGLGSGKCFIQEVA